MKSDTNQQFICDHKGQRSICKECPHSTPHNVVFVDANKNCDTADDCWAFDATGEYTNILVKCKPVRKKIPSVTPERELQIYRDLLLKIHDANWMFNTVKIRAIMHTISDYAYARTNTNEGNAKQEEKLKLKTLLDLEKL